MKLEFREIGMTEVESFYTQIVEDIKKSTDSVYELDFSEVETISLPAIQVLLSLKKYCDSQELTFKCVHVESNSILQSLETYNLKEKLGVK